MLDFFEALTSKSKNTALPDEFNYFENLSEVGQYIILRVIILQ